MSVTDYQGNTHVRFDIARGFCDCCRREELLVRHQREALPERFTAICGHCLAAMLSAFVVGMRREEER